LAVVLGGCIAGLRDGRDVQGDWPTYGNDAGGTRYSPLTQIDRGNVGRLRVAWTYRTGESTGWANTLVAFEATPIVVDGTLYLSTPFGRVIALDPETGAERWTYDPKVDRSRPFPAAVSRGVSTWLDAAAEPGRACRRRTIDLTSGDVRWEVPLDTTPELSEVPEARHWGSPNTGGALTTAGGLVFIAAARDTALRAFDVETGTMGTADHPSSFSSPSYTSCTNGP